MQSEVMSSSGYNDLIVAKWVTAFVMGIMTMAIGIAPQFCLSSLRSRNLTRFIAILEFIHTCAGGVLLSTVFLKMMPEVIGTFLKFEEGIITKNPIFDAMLVIFPGFFILCAVDVGLHICVDYLDRLLARSSIGQELQPLTQPSNPISESPAVNTEDPGCSYHHATSVAVCENDDIIDPCPLPDGNPCPLSDSNPCPLPDSNPGLLPDSNPCPLPEDDDIINPCPLPEDDDIINPCPLPEDDDIINPCPLTESKPRPLPDSNPYPLPGFNSYEYSKLMTAIEGCVLLFSLTFHELVEGMNFWSPASPEGAWYKFGAMVTYKFVIAHFFGYELFEIACDKSLATKYIFIYSLVYPIGIVFGMQFITVGNGKSIPVGPAVAIGTLLYGLFFKILHKVKRKTKKWIAVFLGFVVMVLIQAFVNHQCSHS